MNSSPLVSICIPTYNRARYLDSLLSTLTRQFALFPHSYEIFVGDNASTDNTAEVVENYRSKLPLRYVRHSSNLGGAANWQHLATHAKGRYFVYLADDDAVLGPELAGYISVMEALPEVGVAYSPWRLFDLVADKDFGQFYQQDEDVLVEKGDYVKLLDVLLRYGIFPEIAVYRCAVLRQVMPRVSEQAFYAFVHAAEFACRAQVLLLKDPFYVSITNYFADHRREQAGLAETEYAWDRYRGGLEHVLGRAAAQIDTAQRHDFLTRIQDTIASRIAVAVRLRMHQQRDPVDTYYLAYRLKAINAEQILPVPLRVLASLAAISFLTRDVELNRDMRELMCIGDISADLRQLIEDQAQIPVRFVAAIEHLDKVDEGALLFALDTVDIGSLPKAIQQRLVTEAQLMAKFAC